MKARPQNQPANTCFRVPDAWIFRSQITCASEFCKLTSLSRTQAATVTSTSTTAQCLSHAMPLASNSGPGVQHFVQNRESANTHVTLATRSITPQPQQQRERSRQKHGRAQNEHRARSNSHNGGSGKMDLFGQDPESLKLQIPNTLRKTVSAIPQNATLSTGRGSSSDRVAKTRTSAQVRVRGRSRE